MAGWLTLLDGIKRIDEQCTKRKLDFNDYLKPEELEKYVVSRKEDVLFALRQMASNNQMTERSLLNTLLTQPIATLVDNISDLHAAHCIH